jgi:hypothetical protein
MSTCTTAIFSSASSPMCETTSCKWCPICGSSNQSWAYRHHHQTLATWCTHPRSMLHILCTVGPIPVIGVLDCTATGAFHVATSHAHMVHASFLASLVPTWRCTSGKLKHDAMKAPLEHECLCQLQMARLPHLRRYCGVSMY